MSTMGINVKIDVTKLDKSRFFVGKKGTYANLTLFIDTENPSEYGDHGTIRQQTSKEERQSGVKLPIIGNAKIFTRDDQNSSSPNPQQSAPPLCLTPSDMIYAADELWPNHQQAGQQQQTRQPQSDRSFDTFNDDVPF